MVENSVLPADVMIAAIRPYVKKVRYAQMVQYETGITCSLASLSDGQREGLCKQAVRVQRIYLF